MKWETVTEIKSGRVVSACLHKGYTSVRFQVLDGDFPIKPDLKKVYLIRVAKGKGIYLVGNIVSMAKKKRVSFILHSNKFDTIDSVREILDIPFKMKIMKRASRKRNFKDREKKIETWKNAKKEEQVERKEKKSENVEFSTV